MRQEKIGLYWRHKRHCYVSVSREGIVEGLWISLVETLALVESFNLLRWHGVSTLWRVWSS